MNSLSASKPGLGMRILRFPLTRILLALTFIILPSVLLSTIVHKFLPLLSKTLPITLVGITMALLCYYAFVRLIERRTVSELGLKGAWKELACGLAVGALLFSITIAILFALGVYQVEGTNAWTVIFAPMVMALSSGVVEEIIFRGILFRIMEESLGSWIALLISACVFGLIHLVNPHATLVGAVSIIIEAGIMLGAAYMLTRRLWLCIGIHIAWNFTQAGIFSSVVSGNIDLPGVIKAKIIGPALLTGGEFGVEASIIAVMVCLVAGVFFIIKAKQHNRIIQPFWRRPQAIPAL